MSNAILSSSSYSALGIPSESLDPASALYTGADRKAVLIPFKVGDLKRGVIGLLDNNRQLRTVAYFEAQTELPSERVYESLKAGNFNGGFTFKYEGVHLDITLQNSKIVSSKGGNKGMSGRTLACRDWDSYGGVLWCAGTRLENMNWFDAALCYSSFAGCMGALVISCAIDGCAIQ